MPRDIQNDPRWVAGYEKAKSLFYAIDPARESGRGGNQHKVEALRAVPVRDRVNKTYRAGFDYAWSLSTRARRGMASSDYASRFNPRRKKAAAGGPKYRKLGAFIDRIYSEDDRGRLVKRYRKGKGGGVVVIEKTAAGWTVMNARTDDGKVVYFDKDGSEHAKPVIFKSRMAAHKAAGLRTAQPLSLLNGRGRRGSSRSLPRNSKGQFVKRNRGGKRR